MRNVRERTQSGCERTRFSVSIDTHIGHLLSQTRWRFNTDLIQEKTELQRTRNTTRHQRERTHVLLTEHCPSLRCAVHSECSMGTSTLETWEMKWEGAKVQELQVLLWEMWAVPAQEQST